MTFLAQDKKKELTEQQQKFLDALFGEAEGDAAVAGQLAGYAPSSYPSIVRNLKEEIIERAEHVLALYAPKAAHTLGKSLTTGATELGANIRLQAAEKILDRVGISKKERLEINSVGNSLFILPAKAPVVNE